MIFQFLVISFKMEKLNKEELVVLLEYFKNESEENRQKHRQYLEKDNLQENHESTFHFFRNQTGETKTRLMQVFSERLKHEMRLKKDILKDVKELVKNEKKTPFFHKFIGYSVSLFLLLKSMQIIMK